MFGGSGCAAFVVHMKSTKVPDAAIMGRKFLVHSAKKVQFQISCPIRVVFGS